MAEHIEVVLVLKREAIDIGCAREVAQDTVFARPDHAGLLLCRAVRIHGVTLDRIVEQRQADRPRPDHVASHDVEMRLFGLVGARHLRMAQNGFHGITPRGTQVVMLAEVEHVGFFAAGRQDHAGHIGKRRVLRSTDETRVAAVGTTDLELEVSL